ncbi:MULTISPECIES: xanthine dehydrogenase family protein subunit M [Asticcacaulis]|uniref:FAD binding domain-containing protein n=1 Tax=Asticcacaulis TaxID=76890 RepID=UPI001AE3B0B3|nr:MULTISPECIES: xanthine dehydrogenase family protein subunit M [Asticcacaulis]MBP2160368.1 xanthine dehydrogenase YagS FAD-binding subunit [Asticcacaulis solisilvae]MDR6801329.1 xanthine dehydrogenase YagS FAD-binding subunit [Asticcacaulis sp. BE141]
MRPFVYDRAATIDRAVQLGAHTASGQADAPVQFLAGGTTVLDLMKLDVMTPQTVIDITPLKPSLRTIETGPAGLRLGAGVTMAEAAGHDGVRTQYPVIADSLKLAASAQIRNMATLGGNVLQRTRCGYYRDPSWSRCNKRVPGSGCEALTGPNRNHAVLGVSKACIAQYPGDFAVALVALEAQVEVDGPDGRRTLPFEAVHRGPDQPHIEHSLKPGELITGFFVPPGAWTRSSLYLKIRDRASYEFAIASAAVALDLDGDVVRDVRIGLGGMAYRPWRAREAEALLKGEPLSEDAAEAAARAALKGAVTHEDNAYKPELGRRTLVRALLEAARMEA